jgi:hypothetical protein
MNAPAPDDDDTIRVRRKPPARAKKRLYLIGLGAALLACIGGGAGGYWLLADRSPAIQIDTETEAQIDAAQPCAIKVSKLAADANIIVIDFPNLRVQGLILDRVAALIEKAGLPRDRVLDDVQLNQAIFNCGDTIETYYYGHDYQASDLAKFFALAEAGHIQLNANELWLKGLLKQLGWLSPGANGALITLPAAAPPITQEFRAVILHHEISHGAFYTDATYRKYATDFWSSLTDADRAAFTKFLGTEGYDTTDTTLMLNETQAYLIFTRDPHFFNAGVVGMTDEQINALRAGFIANMPDFWLRPLANAPLPVANTPPPLCQSETG